MNRIHSYQNQSNKFHCFGLISIIAYRTILKGTVRITALNALFVMSHEIDNRRECTNV